MRVPGVSESDSKTLNQRMQVLCGVMCQLGRNNIQVLQQIKGNERSDTLAVWWNLVHPNALFQFLYIKKRTKEERNPNLVIDRNRFFDCRSVVLQII